MAITLGGGRRKGRGFDAINVTPLLDVLLVLLVVFMVTAPLLTTGLRVELPRVEAVATPVKDTKLVVTVTREERILFGETDVTANLEDALVASERIQVEKELYIRADKEARYGPIARVVAAARAAGVEGLNLLVEPEVVEEEKEKGAAAAASASALPGEPPP